MTIDEAIEYHIKAATQRAIADEEMGVNDKWNETKFMTKKESERIIADNRQFAKWLTELKELREENKVLTSECDRLIKEKGELLSKVSGGDVLRICQLEEQLKHWKEEYANLNKISYDFYKELKEAKRLLKSAIDEWNLVCEWGNCGEYCGWFKNGKCTQEWSGKAEALKLIES